MYYHEVQHILHLQGSAYSRYARLYSLFNRICLAESANFQSDYATLFSRLIAVCQAKGIDHRAADRFRHNARRVLQEERVPNVEEERADVADLCHFIYQLTQSPIPTDLPQAIRPLRVRKQVLRERRTVRGVVTEILTPTSFRCLVDQEEDHPFTIRLAESGNNKQPQPFTSPLYPGANVMLLDAVAAEGATDTLEVYFVILEPDYLIDVSSLTACIKPYGTSPLNYLINALAPNEPTRYTLIGNLANQFMDDCINGDLTDPQLYLQSLRTNYSQTLLDFACMPAEEVGAAFFAQAKVLFDHIHQTVAERFAAPDIDIDREDVILEPSFICPTLGLRGRLDVMTLDHQRVLELKSGKAEEFYREVKGPKPDHLLQMTLYGEILRRNFHIDWNEVRTFLFYAAYPRFFNERPSASAIREILHLRNGILRLIHCLQQGEFERILPKLTPDYLNSNQLQGRFYDQYLRPQIEEVTQPLQQLNHDELLREYFTQYVTFVEREMFMSKTSDNRPDSIRGFAATWTADRRTKLMAGNLLDQLELAQLTTDERGGITTVCFHLPTYDADFVPNFNQGEMVQIYEADCHEEANVTNRQLVRGTVTALTAESLTITLAYRQRNLQLFTKKKRYAVEHDATDGPAAQQLRNLFGLLTATTDRQNLLLGRRSPQRNLALTLRGSYSETVESIVLQAKQAQDYYLLVGPPGTGKTNLALRSMVKEYLLEAAIHTADATYLKSHALLLSAYTNRAVDEICSMLDDLSQELTFDYLRIGNPQTCATAHHAHLLSERAATLPRREDVRHLIDTIPIIVGTVITLTNNRMLFRRKTFATAILDEASQLLEPQVMGLLTARQQERQAIGKFILIGDHKQLPAVVMLPESQTQTQSQTLRAIGLTDLRNSLFERLHQQEAAHGRTAFVGMLYKQGRMHPDIATFVNRYFYDSRLTPVPLPHQTETLQWAHADGPYEQLVARTRLGFIPVSQTAQAENLRANAPEAEAVCLLAQALCSLHAKNGQTDFQPAHSIGVIVPFRSQIAGIRSALRQHGFSWADEVTIDTVECYQGSQRDYILFSTTISEPYQLDILSSIQEVENCPVDRKLNVALTRARRQLFLFGNPQILNQNPLYKALIASCTVMQSDW